MKNRRLKRKQKNRRRAHGDRFPTDTDANARLSCRGSAGAGGAHGGVAELGHGRCHGGGHRGGGDAVFSRLPPLSPAAVATEPVAAAAGEGGQQGLAEARVHEAVNDGVDAGRGVGQQVDEGDGRSGEGSGGRPQVKGLPGVGRVQRHPADEEERHDHHQHADDSPLGLQLGLGGVAARALRLGLGGAGRGRERGELHSRGGFFRHLDVATVVVIVGPCESPSDAVLLACGGSESLSLVTST